MSDTKKLQQSNWDKFQIDLRNNLWEVVHEDTIKYLDNCGIDDDFFDNIDDYVEFANNVMEQVLYLAVTNFTGKSKGKK